MAAPVYADTSFLVSLYVHNANTARAVAAVLGPNYPERISRVYIVNAPQSFAIAYSLFSTVLTRRLLDKVSLFSATPAGKESAAAALLAEPARVRWFLEKRVQASKLVPVGFMLAVLVASAYIHAPLEDPPVRACRALAFTLLAFAWVYVVGIHTPQGIEYLKETSCQFVVRLAPVLYSPLWLAALFSPAAVAALALQHSLRQHSLHRRLVE